jgi:hypothetical protein
VIKETDSRRCFWTQANHCSINPDVCGLRKNHNCYNDLTCREKCPDVLIGINNQRLRIAIEASGAFIKGRLGSYGFTQEKWCAGSVHDLGIEHFRFDNLETHATKLKEAAIGWTFGESVPFRQKVGHVAIMCFYNDTEFWFHIRDSEFYEIFVKNYDEEKEDAS